MDRDGDRTASGHPADGSGSSELAELRSILIGQDLEQLSALEHRLNDPQIRAAETGAVLPAAIKASSGKGLRDAFQPLFERLFRNSVIQHPRDIADAIYPVMGPAIRSYVAAAIREFAESLNQIVEKSASFRAIQWRIEARVTGRPFTEILLSRSLLYSVDQVFLIHRKSGLLLAHLAAESAVVKDADMVSGMFSAIQDFVSDSFTQAGMDLETIDVGRYKLWIQYGSKALLVGAVSGTAPVELRDVFRGALEKIHEELSVPLDGFKQGDTSVFTAARPYLESCLLGRRAPDRRKNFTIWAMVAVTAVLVAGLVFWNVRNHRRWDAYIDALQQQPGIVVTGAERKWSGGRLEGLKDPQAPDPATLLAPFQLDPANVRYAWKPYLSLGTPFAAEREVQADVNYIQRQIIRFEVASSRLPLGEAGQLDEISAAINRVLKVRPASHIIISGHTDELGTPEENARLSLNRAETVRQALLTQGLTQGIPPDLIVARGAGNAEPISKGSSEWDLAANRSVSIHIERDLTGESAPKP